MNFDLEGGKKAFHEKLETVTMVMVLKKCNTRGTDQYTLQKIINLGVGVVINLNCCGLFFPPQFILLMLRKGRGQGQQPRGICLLQKIRNLLAQNELLKLNFRVVFCNKLEFMKEVGN